MYASVCISSSKALTRLTESLQSSIKINSFEQLEAKTLTKPRGYLTKWECLCLSALGLFPVVSCFVFFVYLSLFALLFGARFGVHFTLDGAQDHLLWRIRSQDLHQLNR